MLYIFRLVPRSFGIHRICRFASLIDFNRSGFRCSVGPHCLFGFDRHDFLISRFFNLGNIILVSLGIADIVVLVSKTLRQRNHISVVIVGDGICGFKDILIKKDYLISCRKNTAITNILDSDRIVSFLFCPQCNFRVSCFHLIRRILSQFFRDKKVGENTPLCIHSQHFLWESIHCIRCRFSRCLLRNLGCFASFVGIIGSDYQVVGSEDQTIVMLCFFKLYSFAFSSSIKFQRIAFVIKDCTCFFGFFIHHSLLCCSIAFFNGFHILFVNIIFCI